MTHVQYSRLESPVHELHRKGQTCLSVNVAESFSHSQTYSVPNGVTNERW